MAMKVLIRGAAVALTMSRALVLESGSHASSGSVPAALLQWEGSFRSDLPRTVVQASESDGCGENLTGYVITAKGLMWSDFQPLTARNVMECRHKCDSAHYCVGFTARHPRQGPMQCNLYAGLAKKYDPKAMSYVKCPRDIKCPNSEGFVGFQYSHQGTWKEGVRSSSRFSSACSKQCNKDRSCVAFTYRHTKDGTGECFLFANAANKDGPKRDMRATTYSKCAFQNPETASVLAEIAPPLPLSTMMSRSGNVSCTAGYANYSRGWWWRKYDKLAEAGDPKACMQKCDSFQRCVSFVYRPMGNNSGECFMYTGQTAVWSEDTQALVKCQPGSRCEKGRFRVSHEGTWEGGNQMGEVTFKGCTLICENDPSCTAFSWKRGGELCTTFSFKSASPTEMAPAGAEGYAKCSTDDT